MSDNSAVTSSIINQTVPIPLGNTITVTDTNSYQQYPIGGTFQGPITITTPWVSGGSGSGWGPFSASPLTPTPKKKPRKPRVKKVLPAHEQEMKEAEAKWKKILDGSNRK